MLRNLNKRFVFGSFLIELDFWCFMSCRELFPEYSTRTTVLSSILLREYNGYNPRRRLKVIRDIKFVFFWEYYK